MHDESVNLLNWVAEREVVIKTSRAHLERSGER